jgi:hypothetical protein
MCRKAGCPQQVVERVQAGGVQAGGVLVVYLEGCRACIVSGQGPACRPTGLLSLTAEEGELNVGIKKANTQQVHGHGEGMAKTWQIHTWQRHGQQHGQRHGKDMANTWQRHGKSMATTWPLHGSMAKTWQTHGKHTANTVPAHGGNVFAMSLS